MMRRFLLSGAILLFILALVPACGDSKPSKSATPTMKDEAPPIPKPGGGGKAG
jgi:hypothetical protein